MISNEEKEKIRKLLPELIRTDPTIRGEIIGLLEGVLATKEDLQQLIQSMEKRFEAVDRRFEAMASKEDLQQLIQSMEKRFEAMASKEDLQQLIQSMEKRFEAVDRRFEAVDRRFEAVDRRFEAVDRRFEEMIKEIKVIKTGLGSLGSRAGKGMEKMIIEYSKEIIERDLGIDVEKIRQLIIIDDNGTFYHKGAEIEYDMFMDDGSPILFEMKFHPEKADVNNFLMKAKFFEKVKKQKPELYLIAISLEPDVTREAKKVGIKVIGQTTEGPETIHSEA